MVIHVVQAGESLYSIAKNYGVDPALLAAENGFSLQQTLVVGQTVVVQFPDVVHRVRSGESLSAIAQQYGTDVTTLYRNNRWLMGRSTIREGELLVISYFGAPKGRFAVSGYAYATIERGLLRSVLPYLSNLIPFTYGLTQSGGLLPLADEELLAIAADYETRPVMHLSTITEEGTFSNGRASMVLNDPALQQRLAAEVLETIQRKGYTGRDVDFEFIFPEERERYAEFVALLRRTLAPYDYPVTVALAPKTAADQRGLLYEGHDYALLGAAADYVFLMTYEWGYTYGPPMAVAPLPNVRQVLAYALTEIPAEKIILGVPNYGYDWPLPFVQGSSRAQSISNETAVELARRHGAQILFDETGRAPWFRYVDEMGLEHEVWFEDARSIEEKLLLPPEYGLHGAGYWNLDRPFAQNWLVVNALYQIL